MIAFASSAAVAVTAAPLPSPAALAGQPASAPLTRVALAYIEPRFKLYLRFGEPARIKVSAFTQGVTVADLLRGLLEREFPEHRKENTP